MNNKNFDLLKYPKNSKDSKISLEFYLKRTIKKNSPEKKQGNDEKNRIEEGF